MSLYGGVAAICTLCAYPAISETVSGNSDISQKAAVKQLDAVGRQEMLSHQLASVTCFTENGIEPFRAKVLALEAHSGLQDAHSRLRHGDETLQLLPVSQPKILAILDAMEPYIIASYQAVEGLLNQEGEPSQHLQDLKDLSWTVSTQARGVNAQLRVLHRDAGVLPPELEQTISALNEMRVLSQVLGKSFCNAAFERNPEASLTTFSQTSERMNILLAGFAAGSESLKLPKPHAVMAQQISIVADEYAKLSAIIDATLAEQSASPQFGPLMLNQSFKVLNELDNSLYLLATIQ